jgi:hypothetical protein
MLDRRRARAGIYARQRYLRGLKSYRRRMRTPLLVVVVPMFVFFWVVVFLHKLDPWSIAAGAVGSSAVALIIFVRDDPPQHVINWRRGAEGERKTERALKPLEHEGWTAEHDVQRDGRGNLDHILRSPRGAVFLLETKNLAGTITFTDGVLQARQFDDPDEIYRYTTLASRLRGQAKELSAKDAASTGRRVWVNAVAVIWGDFHDGIVESGNVTYVRGDQLIPWLRAKAGATSSSTT